MGALLGFGADAINYDAACQQLCALACIYNSDQQSLLNLLEADADLLLWKQYRGTWPASYAVIRNRQNGAAFVVIEGTTNIDQALLHLTGMFGYEYEEGKYVMGPWWIVANAIRADIETALGPDWKSKPMFMSGHSYGGSLVHVLGNIWTAQTPAPVSVSLLTMGEPKSYAGGIDTPQPAPHWRLNSTYDFVPTVPPIVVGPSFANPFGPPKWEYKLIPWEHFGTEVVLYNNYPIVAPFFDVPSSEWETNAVPDAHYLRNYFARLKAQREWDGN